MSKQQELWKYATAAFLLPHLRLQAVSRVIGIANIDAIAAAAAENIARADENLAQVQATVTKLGSKRRESSLLVEEIRSRGTSSSLIKQNMGELIELLTQLRAKATEQKFVLPQFRGVEHFKIGDEIMIYVAEGDDRKVVEYDWISGKMLCPGWDWIMHCHSNVPWTRDGSNGGHYFRTTSQNALFKRSDFYGLRRMLERGEDVEFTNLLPADLAEKILKGSVDPLTDEELGANQASYIKKATRVVDFYAHHVPIIAERHDVAA